ncbi:MAG: YcxB family protein [Ferruginibacter sp.]
MQPSIQIVQDFTLAESIRTTLFIAARMKIIQRVFIFGIIISALGGVMELMLFKGSKGWLSVLFSFLIVPLFMLLFFGGLLTIIVMIMYRLNPNVFKGNTYKFTSWGMERIYRGRNYTASWRQFTGFKETGRFIYLFMDKECHPIQKRFLSHNEIATIVSFVKGSI